MKAVAAIVVGSSLVLGTASSASAADWRYYKSRTDVVEVKKKGKNIRLLGYTRNSGGGSGWCFRGRANGTRIVGVLGVPTPDFGPVKRGQRTAGQLRLTKVRVRVNFPRFYSPFAGKRAWPDRQMRLNHKGLLRGAKKACGF